MEGSCNDGGGGEGSREAIDQACKVEGKSGCRMHIRLGGARGHMMSGCHGQHSQCHTKKDQDLCQINEVVEGRQQGKKPGSQMQNKKELELRRGH